MRHSRLKRLRPNGQFLTIAGIASLTVGLLGYKLYSLNPGLAAAETALPTVKATLSTLWNQPLEAPIHISRLLVAILSPTTGIGLSRLPSVLLGILLVLVSYWLIKKWYGYRLALFGAVLLITAPWFLHVSRLATSDVVYPLAMTLVMLLAALWHQKAAWSRRLIYASALTVAGLLYVPGALWLLLVVVWFERKNIAKQLGGSKKHAFLAAGAAIVFLAPLFNSLINNWHSYRQLLGLPSSWPAPLDYLENFARSWQHIFVGGLDDPIHNLATLPVSNAFISLSFIVGGYLYAKHPKATRTRQLLGLWLVGTALVAFHGLVSYTLLLPIVLVLAVGGIGYLLHLWLKTFPRNPYARSFGIGLLVVVVVFAVAYNLRNYYAAWPNSPAVRAVFTRQL